VGVAGHGGDGERLLQALEHPFARGLQAVAAGGRQRSLHELRLPAGAVRCHHHPPRDRRGRHRAGVPPADGQRVAAALVVVADDLRRDRQVEGDDLARSQK
jgi:hypothetical protein